MTGTLLFVGAYITGDTRYKIHRVVGTREHVLTIEGYEAGRFGSKSEAHAAARKIASARLEAAA